jgi:predicted MPP superfamily phosphohydrolase
MMKSILFFLLFLLFFFALHYLFYTRVIKKLLFAEKVKKLLSVILWGNFTFNLLYVVERYSDLLPGRLYYLFSLSIGVSFVLLLYLVVHEVLELFHRSIKHLDHSKRCFFKKSGDAALLALSTSYLGAAAYEGSKFPVVKPVKFGKFGFSIVQISDFHIGGLIDRDFVRHAVAQINALSPDIVCITGDLVDTSLERIQPALHELQKIRSKHGIYYVLGNHEYFHQPEKIITYFKDSHITLLLNEHITLDTLQLNIVGVTDLIGLRVGHLQPDFHQAFTGIKPHYQTLLLSHQSKSVELLGFYTPTLILSGHTHGGQIWPFGSLVTLQQPYLKGLHTLPNGVSLYVNSGIGFWGPPMRLGSQAEITYIT